MNGNPGPANLVAVHDLLTEALGQAEDSDTPCGYGIAIYPRLGRFDAPVFGVLTRGGESTTLTHRMLRSLMDHQVLISGQVPGQISDGTALTPSRVPPPPLLDQAVLHLTFRCFIGVGEGPVRTMPLDATVFAGELEAPIILVMERKPLGWPA
ncbi:MAG: hypothetical protein ACT4PM_03490 [Gemmatimonadales bacterium]